MAKNISLMGASYFDVPAVVLPQTGGGTASFTDVTDTTATASDVLAPKVFYSANGVRTVGTGTGSGGLTDDVKTALLNCFEHVAWIDDQGQTYYDALYSALHGVLVSISAVYTQTGTVYTTDSLDVLRPDLVVTATYGDGTTRTVTAYTLSGTLVEGTSTVTVDYFRTTDTFTVNVTDSALAYITAVFTQQGIIYTDDSLDSLKSNLVVTFYSAPGATGTVLADSAYTLSGTLVSGTSTVTVTYEAFSTTFTVDVSASVPSGYTRLKSVRTTGAQYIDTGLNETQVGSAKYEISVTGIASGTDTYDFGQHILSSHDTFFPYFKTTSSGTVYQSNTKRKGNESVSTGSKAFAWSENVKYKIEAFLNGGNGVTVNGTEIYTIMSGSTASASANFYIFTYGGNVPLGRYRFCGHLYSMVIYDNNNNLLRFFVPAKNANNVAGLYDTVNSVFYTSDSEYALIAGEVA